MMRYYCAACRKYWTYPGERYTICDPVRDCPDCLKAQGMRWVDPARAWKEAIQ